MRPDASSRRREAERGAIPNPVIPNALDRRRGGPFTSFENSRRSDARSLGAEDATRDLKTSMADDMSMNPSRDDFEALLDESMGGRDFAEGTVVKGLVAAIEKDFAIIDVGLKTDC